MKKLVKILVVTTIALSVTMSLSIACPGNPDCSCDEKVTQKASCGADCEKACCSDAKTAMNTSDNNHSSCKRNESTTMSSCSADCEKACCSDVQRGNAWKAEDGTEHYTCAGNHMTGKLTDASSSKDVDGATYHFCSSMCNNEFDKDSDRFIGSLIVPGNVISVNVNGAQEYRDPVDDSIHAVSKKTKTYDLDGKRYYFASKKNLKEFKKTHYSS
jgi:YHS domain-containing protein